MTNKELRKLSRAELIDILFELQTQNENLTAENRELAAQLESRQLQITEAGSIAEAALRLNGVFEAAQAAADQYVRCTKDSLAIAERTLAAAKRRLIPSCRRRQRRRRSSLQMQTRAWRAVGRSFCWMTARSKQRTENKHAPYQRNLASDGGAIRYGAPPSAL